MTDNIEAMIDASLKRIAGATRGTRREAVIDVVIAALESVDCIGLYAEPGAGACIMRTEPIAMIWRHDGNHQRDVPFTAVYYCDRCSRLAAWQAKKVEAKA